MAQSDYNLSNTSASSARSKINEVFQAIRTNNSGNGSPANTFANMWWYESDNNRLRMRNEADSGWHNVFYLDSSDSTISIIDGTRVRTGAGAETARIDTHSDSTWETGTNTSARLVSPAQVKAAIEANSFASSQSWSTVTRAIATNYTNNTGQPIKAKMLFSTVNTGGSTTQGRASFSVDGVVVDRVAYIDRQNSNADLSVGDLVPPGSTYRWEIFNGGSPSFVELR